MSGLVGAINRSSPFSHGRVTKRPITESNIVPIKVVMDQTEINKRSRYAKTGVALYRGGDTAKNFLPRPGQLLLMVKNYIGNQSYILDSRGDEFPKVINCFNGEAGKYELKKEKNVIDIINYYYLCSKYKTIGVAGTALPRAIKKSAGRNSYSNFESFVCKVSGNLTIPNNGPHDFDIGDKVYWSVPRFHKGSGIDITNIDPTKPVLPILVKSLSPRYALKNLSINENANYNNFIHDPTIITRVMKKLINEGVLGSKNHGFMSNSVQGHIPLQFSRILTKNFFATGMMFFEIMNSLDIFAWNATAEANMKSAFENPSEQWFEKSANRANAFGKNSTMLASALGLKQSGVQPMVPGFVNLALQTLLQTRFNGGEFGSAELNTIKMGNNPWRTNEKTKRYIYENTLEGEISRICHVAPEALYYVLELIEEYKSDRFVGTCTSKGRKGDNVFVYLKKSGYM